MSIASFYITTQFNNYPLNKRQLIMNSRERIINLRLHAQKIGIYNKGQAEYYWHLSVLEENKLRKWLQDNPPPHAEFYGLARFFHNFLKIFYD